MRLKRDVRMGAEGDRPLWARLPRMAEMAGQGEVAGSEMILLS